MEKIINLEKNITRTRNFKLSELMKGSRDGINYLLPYNVDIINQNTKALLGKDGFAVLIQALSRSLWIINVPEHNSDDRLVNEFVMSELNKLLTSISSSVSIGQLSIRLIGGEKQSTTRRNVHSLVSSMQMDVDIDVYNERWRVISEVTVDSYTQNSTLGYMTEAYEENCEVIEMFGLLSSLYCNGVFEGNKLKVSKVISQNFDRELVRILQKITPGNLGSVLFSRPLELRTDKELADFYKTIVTTK